MRLSTRLRLAQAQKACLCRSEAGKRREKKRACPSSFTECFLQVFRCCPLALTRGLPARNLFFFFCFLVFSSFSCGLPRLVEACPTWVPETRERTAKFMALVRKFGGSQPPRGGRLRTGAMVTGVRGGGGGSPASGHGSAGRRSQSRGRGGRLGVGRRRHGQPAGGGSATPGRRKARTTRKACLRCLLLPRRRQACRLLPSRSRAHPARRRRQRTWGPSSYRLAPGT